ncbi:TPA: hypothetical protein QHB91_005505 [Klebsiella michiganensis]|nr:hypothetical protein [Klebsiella michiganensis]HDT6069821.1 hypothetical protein [Klebsiella michiganensis]
MFHAVQFFSHFVGCSSFSFYKLGIVQKSGIHFIDKPPRIIKTLVSYKSAMHISISTALREFFKEPAVNAGACTPAFNLLFGDLH